MTGFEPAIPVFEDAEHLRLRKENCRKRLYNNIYKEILFTLTEFKHVLHVAFKMLALIGCFLYKITNIFFKQ